MKSALLRYQTAAYTVGTGLLVLVFVAMPLKYIWDIPEWSKIVSPIHGWLYIIYLVITADLARRAQWQFGHTIKVMIAGTIPFMAFFEAKWITKRIKSHSEYRQEVAEKQPAE